MISLKEWRAMREETDTAITAGDQDWESNLNAAISNIKHAMATIKQAAQTPQPPVPIATTQQPIVNPNPIGSP